MNENQLKKRVQIVTALAVCILFTLIIALVGQLISLAQLQSVNNRLLAEKAHLENSYQTMTEEIAYKQSELYAEQYAREKLGLIKEGEQKFVLNSEE